MAADAAAAGGPVIEIAIAEAAGSDSQADVAVESAAIPLQRRP
jgi:hypothetical protein